MTPLPNALVRISEVRCRIHHFHALSTNRHRAPTSSLSAISLRSMRPRTRDGNPLARFPRLRFGLRLSDPVFCLVIWYWVLGLRHRQNSRTCHRFPCLLRPLFRRLVDSRFPLGHRSMIPRIRERGNRKGRLTATSTQKTHIPESKGKTFA